MPPKPVLIATDLSESADEAIRQGHEWAQRHHARLFVCHITARVVGSEMLFPQRIATETTAQSLLQVRAADLVRERTSAISGRSPEQFEVVVEAGSDVEIVRQAENLGVGLIVVGSHGGSGLSRIFLGDVAERVVRHAHCAVLVARRHERSGRILAATDFSPTTSGMLEVAAEEARLRGARLTLLTSIHRQLQAVLSMAEFGSAHPFVEHEHQELRRRAEQQLRELLAEAGVDGEAAVTDASPAAGIVQAASANHAELVVVGAIGGSRLQRLLLGRVAEKVMRHAPCPVLVVRG